MGTDTTSTFLMLGFLVLMFAFFYFLIIRPQRKRQQEHQATLATLKVGERVITIGGLYGEIESMRDDSLVLKMESGAAIRVSRQAVAYRQADAPKAA
jgi:preprotein translocase subunit YajC